MLHGNQIDVVEQCKKLLYIIEIYQKQQNDKSNDIFINSIINKLNMFRLPTENELQRINHILEKKINIDI